MLLGDATWNPNQHRKTGLFWSFFLSGFATMCHFSPQDLRGSGG